MAVQRTLQGKQHAPNQSYFDKRKIVIMDFPPSKSRSVFAADIQYDHYLRGGGGGGEW